MLIKIQGREREVNWPEITLEQILFMAGFKNDGTYRVFYERKKKGEIKPGEKFMLADSIQVSFNIEKQK